MWRTEACPKMALIKQEDEDLAFFGSDQWLLESVKMEEDEKEQKPKLFLKECHVKLERVQIETPTYQNDEQIDNKMMENSKEENVDIEHIKDSKTKWEKILENVPLSEKILNMCRYKCPKCKNTFVSRRGVMCHLKKCTVSSISIKEDIIKHLIKVIAHQCKICYKRVLCEKDAISLHVRYTHKITLKQYINLTKTNIKWHQKQWSEKMEKQQNLWGNIDSAPISQSIGNLCTYKCPKCSTTCTTRSGMVSHFKKSGHASVTKTTLNESLVKTIAHQCYICSKKVLCDKEAIKYHMQRHKLNSLEEYMSLSNVQKSEVIPEEPKSSSDIYRYYQNRSAKYTIKRQVGNLCKFLCTECDFKCVLWRSMRYHVLKKKHGKLHNVTKYLFKVTFHQCHECNEIVLCDKIFISNHILLHNMSMTTYIKSASKEKLTIDVQEQYLRKLRAFVDHIPVVKAMDHFVSDSHSLPSEQTTKHVGNISFFQCLKCSKTNLSFNALLKHSSTKHKIRYLPYNSKNVVEVRYHRCHTCAKVVICDRYFITRHIHTHKMLFYQYKEKLKKSGGKVIPTLIDYQLDNDVFESLNITANNGLNQDKSDNSLIAPSMISSESEVSD